MKRKIHILLLIIIAILVLGNPTEVRYLNRLQKDYGTMHGGSILSIKDLNQIGKSSTTSYLLWGFYEYTFSTIKVKYFGIAFMTFYLGSNTDPIKEENTDEIIT